MTRFTTLIAAATIAATAPAYAQEAPSIRVATHDLNLSTAHGQRFVQLRIARAAHDLCDTADGRFGSAIRVSQRQCREQAISVATASLPPAARLAAR